ncbi:MAG TPA: RidA family protein [Candidatus Thermoplasmatota archaeon]|jgi:enamine deaminase RidA (YjgF/YER057c/UK114 family)|nr:RidA family protein [Candidatus Thermoplasmatota archaeon]
MVGARIINPPALGRPSGYAHGVLAGHLLFIAGQVGARPDKDGTLRVVGSDFAPQFDTALGNVLEVVKEAGGRPEHVVDMTIFVTNLEQYRAARAALADVWKRHLGRHYPAVTLVEVAGLVEPGTLVEIKATAFLVNP